jgi:hypothetical protein
MLPYAVTPFSTFLYLAMNLRTATILSMVSIGCVVAAMGELRYSVFGAICQIMAVIVSADANATFRTLIVFCRSSPLAWYWCNCCFTTAR